MMRVLDSAEQSGESVDVVLPVLRQHLRHADPVQDPQTRQSLAASCRGHPVEAPG